MHEEVPSNSEEMKWSPESGLPPPLTPEYGYAEVLLAPATPPLSGTVHERKSIEEESSPLRVQLQQLKNEMSKVEEVDGEEVERDSILEQTHKVKNFIESRELLERLVQEGDERLLTKEERANVLSPEVLATLSTEEYVALWKRLSPHYVSHVTRQGYRENYFTYHSKGLGEFHDGFKGILENGKDIKSPMMISGDSNGVEMQKKLADYLEHIDFSQLESEDPWDSGGGRVVPKSVEKIKNETHCNSCELPQAP